MADDIVQRIRENLPCIEWEQPLAAERERLAADEIVRLRSIFDRDELYPIIDKVLSERLFPHMNAGSEWIGMSDDVELRIHELAEALCDAIVTRLTGGGVVSGDDIGIIRRMCEGGNGVFHDACLAVCDDNERLRAALALAIGELSTYGPMRYTSPDQLLEHFMQEARRG